MSESISATIDRIALSKITFSPSRKIFDANFVDNWATKSQELCNEFRELQGLDQRQQWLRSVFCELFDLIYSQKSDASMVTMPQVSKLVEDIVNCGVQGLKESEVSSLVGKMFVAVSNSFADEDENVVLALARITNSLHREMFKFSRLSTKLMNHGQTVLLKHLLKKSKYELKKFNLLAECSTGYTQVVMLLLAAYYDPDRLYKVPFWVEQFQNLAGKYRLDSMRCLDIILHVSSEFITDQYEFLIEFLKHSEYWPQDHPADNHHIEALNQGGNIIASNLITFELNQPSAESNINYLDMVCILIQNGFVNFLSIWSNLKPVDEVLEKFFEKFDSELEAESMKGVTNPLAMADALTAEDDEPTLDRDEKKNDANTAGLDGEAEVEKNKTSEEKQQALTEENIRNEVLHGGRLVFLQRLLAHGCIIPALHVLQAHPHFLHIDDLIPRLVARIFDITLEPLYRSMVFEASEGFESVLALTTLDNGLLSKKARLFKEKKSHNPFPSFELGIKSVFYYAEWSKHLTPLKDVDDLFIKSHEYFRMLGPSLGKVPQVISKVCRIGATDIKKDPENLKGVIQKWISYVRELIFPAIPVLEVNPTITSEIYELMQFFPFKKRYFLYNELITKTSQNVLLTKVGFNKAERKARSFLKALSVDTIEVESRKLANLISTNPFATLIPAVKQIENYDKVSELMVITTKYFNDFAYDVLQFVLLLRLTHNRPVIQTDGVNQNIWVQRLSVYIAGLVKSCPKMDITNILVFIVKTLHNGNIVAVSILRELVTTVGGIRDLNEVNMTRLVMLNSGEPLKREARRLIFDSRDDNLKLASKLVSQLAKQNTISELILLLYNLNREANTEAAHYKILSTRCDEMNTLLWAFIELVKYCFTLEEFADNVFSLEILTNDFHVSTSWAFHIWRDYIDQKFREENPSADSILKDVSFEGVDFTNISKELFLTFWKLSLYDVQFDRELYDKYKSSLEDELSNSSSTRKKNEYSEQIKDLLVKCISHQKTFNNSKRMIAEHSTFRSENLPIEEIMSFLQYCVVPRVLFSPADALFSSHFVLQSFAVQNTMKILKVFISSRVLGTLLFCCTRSEAGNMGIFITQLLTSLEKRRLEKTIEFPYSRELYDCNSLLTEQVVELLLNKNYMSIRNGIEFMKHVSHIAPIVDTQIKMVCKALEKILVSEDREDIKLPSNALLGHLNARLKKSCKLEDFCEMNEQEMEAKNKFIAEVEEIKYYQNLVTNEKKEVELRKQLELNKKQREEAEKAKHGEKKRNDKDEGGESEDSKKLKHIPTGPSSDKQPSRPQGRTWPFGKVIRFMDEVCYHLGKNNLNRAADCISDPAENQSLKKLLKEAMPIRDFRNSLFKIFERFFRSLVYYPNNSEFTRKLEEIKSAIKLISNDSTKIRGELYSESLPSEPAMKRSRYNNNDSSRPSSKDLKTDSNEGTSGNWGRGYESRNRPPPRSMESKRPAAAPRTLSFPERPSQARSEVRNSKMYLAREQGSGSRSRTKHDAPHPVDDRPPKRYRADENRSRMRLAQNENRSPPGDSLKDSDRPKFNATKRGGTQKLPQGPKGSGEYVSRYQR